MARRTSAEAYRKIKQDGLLGRLQWCVYDALYRYGPKTEGEIWKIFENNFQRHSIAPRVAELKRMGLVTEVDERPCALTGRICIAWDVTENLPEKPKEDAPKETIRSLKERIAYLEHFIEKELKRSPQQELGL